MVLHFTDTHRIGLPLKLCFWKVRQHRPPTQKHIATMTEHPSSRRKSGITTTKSNITGRYSRGHLYTVPSTFDWIISQNESILKMLWLPSGPTTCFMHHKLPRPFVVVARDSRSNRRPQQREMLRISLRKLSASTKDPWGSSFIVRLAKVMAQVATWIGCLHLSRYVLKGKQFAKQQHFTQQPTKLVRTVTNNQQSTSESLM